MLKGKDMTAARILAGTGWLILIAAAIVIAIAIAEPALRTAGGLVGLAGITGGLIVLSALFHGLAAVIDRLTEIRDRLSDQSNAST